MNIAVKQSRPVSVIVTQILMALSLVPITLGLVFSFLRALVMYPSDLISVRAILFFGISFVLMIVFLGYGFGGMWKRKKIGYWLGLLFLAIGIMVNIYRLVPNLYSLLTTSNKSPYLVLGHRSAELMVVDLAMQSVMLLLVSGLFLKLLVGKNEKSFFTSQSLDIKQG